MSILRATRMRRWWCAAAAATLVGGLLPLVGPQAATPARAADANNATLVVNKGGDRVGEQTVGPLAGATFDFYAGVSGTRPAPGAAPDASCTTDASGKCAVDVPGRTGASQGYWIIERSAPDGWRVVDSLVTGNGSSAPFQSTPYNGVFTGAVANNQTYTFPVETTGNTNRTARGPVWADERDNPALPGSCGLHVALLIDVSGSIRPDLPVVKNAANGFVDALTGTPSEIALYTFATDATAVLNPTPVSDQAGANTVKDAINGLTAGGTTNWDQGLWQIAAAPFDYDAVIILTDGNPTVYGPPPVQGSGSYTRFVEVENGIFSANAVKAKGTRVVAVGVGAGVSGAPDNLIAISGPVANSDYYQTGYDQLAAVFRELALENCRGTVSVVKKVIPPGGGDPQPAGGWTVSSSSAGVTPPSAVTDTSTGAVNLAVDLGGQPSRAVAIAETPQAGFSLVPQDGLNATCAASGQPVLVTNNGDFGFNVNALANDAVTCVILNQAEVAPATVVVNKTWVINGQTYPDPEQGTSFQAALVLPGIDQPAWGVEYHDYEVGQSIIVDENITALPPGCTNTASGDLGEQTLAAGTNTFQITNTATCETKLALVKSVRNPYGVPEPPASAWDLTAYGPNGFTVKSGDPARPVVEDAVYALGESTVPGFTQTVVQGAVIVPPATGSWSCALRQRDGSVGNPGFDGTDGRVSVQIGQTAVCTAVNEAQPAQLTLVKEVRNTHGGTAKPTDWVLSAIPPAGSATPVTGRSGQPAVTKAAVNPNVGYTLAESDGPAGYEQVGAPTCVLTGTQTPVQTPDNVLTPTFGQDITCTFVNADVPPPPPAPGRVTLVKEVQNTYGGTAKPTDWVLSATPPDGSGADPVSGRSGEPVVTDASVVAGVPYALGESGGPSGYELTELRCVFNDTGEPAPTPDNVLTPAAGRAYTCTWRNGQLDPGGTYLTLVKKVWGKAAPTEWTLSATPQNAATPISGPSGSAEVTRVSVQAGVGYRLTESGGPQGYQEAGAPECVLTGTDTRVPVVDRVVTPAQGQDVTCTFTNRMAEKPFPPFHPGKHLPVTGMKLTGVIGGGALAVTAGVVLTVLGWRRRRSV
ncbi:VWA domain-containing protein [Micromonospora sediminicola]|uniref:VWA domain-containing protein n=1 Tax=Micromonospora sediminicola TaxID=946078 RepID=UPI0033B48C75